MTPRRAPLSNVTARGLAVSIMIVFAPLACHRGAGAHAGPGAAAPLVRPQGPLDIDGARRYVLALVNRDRRAEGLADVAWDDTAAHAGQRHADDMTRHGFTAHWGTDGSVPEQRYTEAGGRQMARENAACFFDGETRELDAAARFDPIQLEKIEAAFLDEKPPNDGHRKNILEPVHTHLGVGLSQPRGVPQPCMAQEFVDETGSYDPVAQQARLRTVVHVSGEVKAPIEFGGVGLARIEPAVAMTPAALNRTNGYAVPSPYTLHFPPGFQGPSPTVTLRGGRFSIELPLDDRARAGRYELSIWGKYPGHQELVIVSLRTLDVR